MERTTMDPAGGASNRSDERRRFLKLFALGVGGCAATGCSLLFNRSFDSQTGSGEFASPTSGNHVSAASAAISRPLEILRRPIELGSGDVLENRRFLLAPDFAWTPVIAAIYGRGSGITIRNVEVVGSNRWLSRWNQYNEPVDGPPGIPSGCVGIRLQETPGVQVLGVDVRGFPGAGITAFGIDEAIVDGVSISDCFHGFVTEWYKENRRVRISSVTARDLWGPPPGKWPSIGGPRSARFSEGFVGGDGLVLASLRQSTVTDCEVVGEQFASVKLVNPIEVDVSRIRGVGLMVQGTSDLEWKIDRKPARDVTISDCVLDKSLGSGAIVDVGNAIQVSWNVEGILIRRCEVRAAGHDGHAIEFAKNVHGRIEDCTIEGFNGRRSTVPACAINVIDHSSVNEDFSRVNRFVNQDRLIAQQT